MADGWTKESWRSFDARQQPRYADPAQLAAATRELAAYPALVGIAGIDALKAELAEAQAGRAFLLQGGDCAESFAEFSAQKIQGSYRLIAAMAERLAATSALPIIRVGRMAGQFAKPRSAEIEHQGGAALPAYRGDIVNGIAFDAAARAPDPERMFRAYAQATATLAHLRQLAAGDGARFSTSHEALLLPFEEALVRQDAVTGRAYGSSAHLLWIGDRTRFPGSAHVEFARGLANPLGLKCGPGLDPATLIRLLDTLDPAREPGRITLIARMGDDSVGTALPPLIRAARSEGHPVLWSCDPMHGNTIKAANGYKTRPFGRILSETAAFFAITRAEGVIAGGIHIEMTGQNVTECTGGAVEVSAQDLGDRHHTQCAPRLTPGQAHELAALLADELCGHRDEGSSAAA